MLESANIPENTDIDDFETSLILVVEDDEGLNNLIRKSLNKAGYKTAGVATGREAIEYVIANRESVLLIDMKLPDMSGKEIIDSLREKNSSVSFIVITGHGDERVAVEMMKLGASDYMPKSLDFLERLPTAFQRLFRERATERRLQAAESRINLLSSAVEQSADTVVITDTDAVIQYANPSFERITGYIPSEAIGQNPRFLQSGQHDELFYKDLWYTLLGGETWSGRLINKKKDGSIFTEEATITPVHSSSGEIVNFVAVKRDISREIKLEEQLRQSHKMEAVGQLAGGIAHDFNNILQGIFGYIMFAQEDLDPEEKRYKDIEEIRKCAERAAQLTKQLLSFSRRQIMQPKNINLNNLIDEILKMVRRVIGEHIELEFISGNSLKTISVDPGQIEQVILNLCVNARDSMPGGGRLVLETKNISVDSKYIDSYPILEPGQYVLVSVTDTGIGMDSDTMDRIFEPFFTTKSVGQGTGLGLSMVHGIVTQHSGFINADSEVDKGTVFRVYLPAVEQSAVKHSNPAEEMEFRGSETILIAEDDLSVQNILIRILEGAGYTVHAAGDGEAGLFLFRKYSDEIDLALLDVVMPKLGGKQMLLEIREEKPELPVLFSSGYSESAIHTDFVLDEGIELIQKPYSTADLLGRVRKALDQAKQK